MRYSSYMNRIYSTEQKEALIKGFDLEFMHNRLLNSDDDISWLANSFQGASILLRLSAKNFVMAFMKSLPKNKL